MDDGRERRTYSASVYEHIMLLLAIIRIGLPVQLRFGQLYMI